LRGVPRATWQSNQGQKAFEILKPLVRVDKGLFNETPILKAQRIRIGKSNYPRREAKWD